MARLSGYLTGQMANPSYGGMLTQGIGQGMQGISDAYAMKRQRHAGESINAILGTNPNDPNAIRSAQAVGHQTGQDPRAVQGMIDKAKNQRAIQIRQEREEVNAVLRQEKAERDKAIFKERMASANYDKEQKTSEAATGQAVDLGLKRYNASPDKLQNILDAAGEDRPAVEQAILDQEKRKEDLEEIAKGRRANRPYSKEELSKMGKLEGMEVPLERYEVNKQEPRAKAALERSYQVAYDASIRAGNATPRAPKVPTPSDVTSAVTVINAMEVDTDREVERNLTSFKDFSLGMDEERPGLAATLAMRLATVRKNDPSYIVSKKGLEGMRDEILAEMSGDVPEEGGARSLAELQTALETGQHLTAEELDRLDASL